VRVGAGLERSTFQASPYSRLSCVNLIVDREDEAWPAVERSYARSLADILMVSDSRELTASESAREDSLERVVGQLEEELAVYLQVRPSGPTDADAGSVAETRSALFAASAELSAFEREMAEKYPVTEGETYTLEHVQSMLSEDAAIVGWLDVSMPQGAYQSWCYVVRGSGPVVWLEVDPSQTQGASGSPFELTRSFRKKLARPSLSDAEVGAESQNLWLERIAPLLPGLEGVTHLIVIPSSAMLGVPLETLENDEGVMLADMYAVSYAPSATIYTWLAERESLEAGSRMLLVGDPPYCPEHAAEMEREEPVLLASAEPMPEAEVLRRAVAGNDEALALLPRLRGTRDEVASEQELVRMAESGELGGFETIHIATHALVDDERPERSALVLSQVGLPDPLEAAMAGERIYDGVVTAKEILREWDLNADLVTLSGCETGLGKEVMGEGYVGFAHAFLQAGARSLLVSLWKVGDEATSLLMRRFYENWRGKYEEKRVGHVGEPMTKAEALREAKIWLRDYVDEYGSQPYKHPFYWSAFILIGQRD
jgi:CHAT domain-containing protein